MKILVRRLVWALWAISLASCMHVQPPAVASQTDQNVVIPAQGSGQCTTVADCAQHAVEAAQSAYQAADEAVKAASTALPVGSVIAFTGTPEQTLNLRQNGWWVANGDIVTDQGSALFYNKRLPDLTGKFLLAAAPMFAPASTGGSASVTIPNTTVNTLTTGVGGPVFYGDPRANAVGGETSRNGTPITASGIFPATTLSAMPPYYAVIYLIKVK